jgi:hypothetical protein
VFFYSTTAGYPANPNTQPKWRRRKRLSLSLIFVEASTIRKWRSGKKGFSLFGASNRDVDDSVNYSVGGLPLEHELAGIHAIVSNNILKLFEAEFGKTSAQRMSILSRKIDRV